MVREQIFLFTQDARAMFFDVGPCARPNFVHAVRPRRPRTRRDAKIQTVSVQTAAIQSQRPYNHDDLQFLHALLPLRPRSRSDRTLLANTTAVTHIYLLTQPDKRNQLCLQAAEPYSTSTSIPADIIQASRMCRIFTHLVWARSVQNAARRVRSNFYWFNVQARLGFEHTTNSKTQTDI